MPDIDWPDVPCSLLASSDGGGGGGGGDGGCLTSEQHNSGHKKTGCGLQRPVVTMFVPQWKRC